MADGADLVAKFRSLLESVDAFEWWAIHDYGCPRFMRENGRSVLAMLERTEQAESRIAELESENARLKAVVDACVAWQEKFDCYFCALGSPPHAEDCPLVVGGFIEQSGERVK